MFWKILIPALAVGAVIFGWISFVKALVIANLLSSGNSASSTSHSIVICVVYGFLSVMALLGTWLAANWRDHESRERTAAHERSLYRNLGIPDFD